MYCSAAVPNAELLYPASYLSLWDHAERTGGLFKLRKYGKIPPKAERDIVENGASFLTQSKFMIQTTNTVFFV